MKLSCKFLVFFILISFSLKALETSVMDLPTGVPPEALIANELTHLDNLIEVTKENLAAQMEIRAMIWEYQKLHDTFLEDSTNKELLYKLIKTAHRTLTKIKDNNLSHAFSPEFIGELSMFSKFALKTGIPKS